MIAFVIGDFPMWWLRGHQLSKSSVKIRNASSTVAFTVIDFRTGTSVGSSMLVVTAPPRFRAFDAFLECDQGDSPELIEILAQGRESFRIELVEPTVPARTIDHQAGILQHPQMLGDRGPAD